MDIATTEDIKRLKYSYFRFLDTKQWERLAELFTDDASTTFDSGKYSFDGRQNIMAFLKEGLGSPRVVSMHHGHHPEIEIIDDSHARGIWYLEDTVIFLDDNFILHGAAFYDDEYLKTDDGWKIQRTGYERTFEEMASRDSVTSIRTMFDPADRVA